LRLARQHGALNILIRYTSHCAREMNPTCH